YSPIHVSVLFDVSASRVKDTVKNAKEAVKAFLSSLQGQTGDVSIVAFGNTARIVERGSLADTEKLSAAIDALRSEDRYTDHLAAFVMGESLVVGGASTDGGRAVLLMVTDREVSPPPDTLPPNVTFDEVVALSGLPDMRKSLNISTTVLDFGGAAQG